MGDFGKCLAAAVDAGQISKALAKKLDDADDMFKQGLIDETIKSLSQNKKDIALSAVKNAERWADLVDYDGSKYNGILATLAPDRRLKAGFYDVETRAKYYEAKAHSQVVDLLSRFRTRMVGLSQDKEGLNALVRAFYGDTSDPVLSRMAKDYTDMAEGMRVKFNDLGGSIQHNKLWNMPSPGNNHVAMGEFSKAQYIEQTMPLLDRKSMLNDAGKPLTDAQMVELLDFNYENTISRGHTLATSTNIPLNSQHRVLYFKDGDSWVNYSNTFGDGNAFTTLTDHIHRMAGNSAMVEVLGPRSESVFNGLVKQAQELGEITPLQKSRLRAVYNTQSGKINKGDLTGLADFSQKTSNLVTAGILGGASLAAIADTAFIKLTSAFNDIPAMKAYKYQLKAMAATESGEELRKFSVRLGLTAENMIDHAHAGNRFAESFGQGKSAKTAEVVIRGSGLAAITDSGKKGFGMSYSWSLADDFDKSFSQLSSARKKVFASYGIKENHWDVFRKQTALEYEGVKFANVLEDGGDLFHRMIMSETAFAVPEAGTMVQSMTTGGLERASIPGQGVRALTKLKSFPLALYNTHFQRIAYQTGGVDRLSYAAQMAFYTTLLGGVALQASDMSRGLEPRPMDNAKFWGAAMAKGGGLSLFGDLLFSDVNRYGGGITDTMVGPYAGLIDDVGGLTLGNVQNLFKGEEMEFVKEAARFGKRWAPDVFYTRMISDSILDQVDIFANPDAPRRFHRIMKNRERDYGQKYWREPGSGLSINE